MSEWKSFCLGDVVEFNPAEKIVKGTLAKKIAMEKLQPFCRTVTGYEVEKYNGGVKFRNGDTIMARITPCLENGKTARIDVLDDDEIGFGSTEYVVFRAKENVTVPDFVYYLIRSEVVREPAIKSMVGTSGRQQVQTDYVRNIVINLPPLETQKKIAAVLSALDDKIELNNAINKNLEEQARTIYKNMFVDNFNPDWKSGTLGEFVEVKRGGSPRPIQDYLSDEGLRWLKISDVTALASPYVIKIKEHIKESGLNKTVFLSSGSLVLSNSATPGIPKILDVDTCIHDGWLYFSDSKFSKYFLYLYFKYVKNQLINLGNGSVFTNLKIEIVKSFPVSLPDEKTLSRFDEIIAPLFESMKNIIRENQKLSELRDALLPRLMSGEIDVSKVEIFNEQ